MANSSAILALFIALVGLASAYTGVYPLTTVVPETTVTAFPPPAGVTYLSLWPTFHDFKFSVTGQKFVNGSNPDFQSETGVDQSIVTSTLGWDGNPVYANPSGTTSTTHGNASFAQWYTAGWIIEGQPIYLVLNASNVWTYSNSTFFPLDNLGWGNQGEDINNATHNFGFTAEIHETFTYTGVEWLTVAADDDIFVYINGQLVVNEGGTHDATPLFADLTTWGLAVGGTYTFDLFYAERHTPGATLDIATNIFLGSPSTYPLTTVVPETTITPGTPPTNVEYQTLWPVYHDFKFSAKKFVNGSNPDFQNLTGIDTGIVSSWLGDDDLPVYASPFGVSATTHGQASFNQWWRSGWVINGGALYLTLGSNDVWSYVNTAFFPLDGLGWGNQGEDIFNNSHNFAFCAIIQETFTYHSWQWVTIASDDDTFLYIDGQLVLNNGGTHNATSTTINLSGWGLTENSTYDFDLFYCERHTPGATLSIWTNIYFGNVTAYTLTTVVPETTITSSPPTTTINYGTLWPEFHDFKFSATGKKFVNGSNPDFQSLTGVDPNIVHSWLGADDLPVYRNDAGVTATTHGEATFNQWFRQGWIINGGALYLSLDSNDVWNYINPTFFPLDGLGWGNQGEDIFNNSHNFAFCAVIQTEFVYHGVEWITIASDDDTFLYINGKLVLNNGGTHNATATTLSFTSWGLTVNSTYDFDLFYCERHTPGATLSISTNIYFGTVVNYNLTEQVPTTTVTAGTPPTAVSYIPLYPTFHDFKFSATGKKFVNGSNPDFQSLTGVDPNIVSPWLGADGKPVYRNTYSLTATTHGEQPFVQWFNQGWIIDGIVLYLTLNASNIWVYDNPSFFLIDGQGWGNQGEDLNNVSHNFAFCLELHETFTYTGVEWVSVASDDDTFLYINGQLVINQGGTHAATYTWVDLTTLGLTLGATTDFDLFYCERHTPGAAFHLATNAYLGPATCQWNA